jgi:hypothetical protein
MMFREAASVYSDNQEKPTNKPCRQNVLLCKFKASLRKVKTAQ